MSEPAVADPVVPPAAPVDVTMIALSRKTFVRIEGLKKRVAETTVALDRAAREHKEAKSAHESAQTNLSSAVADMLDEVNGVSKFPLFENQNDAIARAEANPVAQTLLARMVDHGIQHLNVLVVAGYSEEQRAELAKYLDALDANKAAKKSAEETGEPVTSPIVDVPAFLVPQPAGLTLVEVADLLNRLSEQNFDDLVPEDLEPLTREQIDEIERWLADVQRIGMEKGDAATMDDLPRAPDTLLRLAEAEVPGSQSATLNPPAEPVADTVDENEVQF